LYGLRIWVEESHKKMKAELNWADTGGGTWTENSVSLGQVLSRYGPIIKKGAPLLWAVCEKWITQPFAGKRQERRGKLGAQEQSTYELDDVRAACRAWLGP
jgi:hypothetical protein